MVQCSNGRVFLLKTYLLPVTIHGQKTGLPRPANHEVPIYYVGTTSHWAIFFNLRVQQNSDLGFYGGGRTGTTETSRRKFETCASVHRYLGSGCLSHQFCFQPKNIFPTPNNIFPTPDPTPQPPESPMSSKETYPNAQDNDDDDGGDGGAPNPPARGGFADAFQQRSFGAKIDEAMADQGGLDQGLDQDTGLPDSPDSITQPSAPHGKEAAGTSK